MRFEREWDLLGTWDTSLKATKENGVENGYKHFVPVLYRVMSHFLGYLKRFKSGPGMSHMQSYGCEELNLPHQTMEVSHSFRRGICSFSLVNQRSGASGEYQAMNHEDLLEL